VEVENYPIFTQRDPRNVLKDYLRRCSEDGTDPMVDPNNLPVKPPNTLKRKKTKSNETSSKQGQISGSASEMQAKRKSTAKRKKVTVINLEESSAEEKTNSSQAEPHSGKTTSSVTIQNLVNTTASEKVSNVVDSLDLTSSYEDDMTFSSLITKISETPSRKLMQISPPST
jgi:hypothetical protein